MTLVLVAHGTGDPAGVQTVNDIGELVRARLVGTPVAVAFAGLQPPGLATVLAQVDRPAVVVPAFLSSGYHVRVDVPEQVARSGRSDVLVSDPLGPAPALVSALHDRLVAAGWQRGDAVVLGAAGSSDPRALADVQHAAAWLAVRTGGRVRAGLVTTSVPGLTVDHAVARSRLDGGRVCLATWLLAPGEFHRRLASAGADLVAEPLGAHPAVADVVVQRYRQTLTTGLGRPAGRARE